MSACPDVEHRQFQALSRQGLDGGGAQSDATQPAIDPPQVAQVAGQGGWIIEVAVE